jgi:Na+-transporting NADH:ubiquinone oxidoreductase subunit D
MTASKKKPKKKSICGKECRQTVREGLHTNNPVTCQVLGICSCLAVTNQVSSALVMGAALIFVLTLSNTLVSILRKQIPRRIRMIAEVAIIATFVILFDLFLKAFYWDMSKTLGPYVGLIITNCIVMGRAEAFAMQKPVGLSAVDGFANGVGYTVVIVMIAFVRELIGAGTVLGITILSPAWYEANLLFVLAPGAFLTAGCLIWAVNAFNLTLLQVKE